MRQGKNMDLLTILNILESSLTRNITNTKNNGNTITYTGTITSVKVNDDTYTNVYQLFFTHSDSIVTLHVNHSKNNHTSDYSLADINSLTIT